MISIKSIKPVKLSYSLLIINNFLFSCTPTKNISKQANKILINDTAISKGHIGISIYEPATGKYWYNHNADKYFIPASNTKLFTLYTGMKYLGDSLVGLRYNLIKNDSVAIYPTGDPTLLHPGFKKQPVFDFLVGKKFYEFHSQFFTRNLGKGWAWDDYQDNYMVQRSEFPIYGNLIRIYISGGAVKTIPDYIPVRFEKSDTDHIENNAYAALRDWKENRILLLSTADPSASGKVLEIPIVAGLYDMPRFLMDTLHNNMNFGQDGFKNNDKRLSVIYSQPSDSLFKPMMFNSDNFFAEQTLLMASNESLGYMSDEDIIDTLLKTDFKDVPQKPRWVDGSGLSRYNLFTPQSLVYVLDKMKAEFGMERLKVIFPTGGQGTLKNYFNNDIGFIYAKTGSISNNSALSGYLITKKGKLLIFSLIANGYQTGVTAVRTAMQVFLEGIRNKY